MIADFCCDPDDGDDVTGLLGCCVDATAAFFAVASGESFAVGESFTDCIAGVVPEVPCFGVPAALEGVVGDGAVGLTEVPGVVGAVFVFVVVCSACFLASLACIMFEYLMLFDTKEDAGMTILSCLVSSCCLTSGWISALEGSLDNSDASGVSVDVDEFVGCVDDGGSKAFGGMVAAIFAANAYSILSSIPSGISSPSS